MGKAAALMAGFAACNIFHEDRPALEILRSTDIDLVTIDLNMPGMKGDELIRLCREEFPQTEMIVR